MKKKKLPPPPKKKTKTAGSPAKAKPEEAKIIEDNDDDEDTPSKRRQLERRDTDDQVERIRERKLPQVAVEVLKTKENAKGIKAKEYIAMELRAKRKTKGRLSTAFWVRFWEEYDFAEDIAGAMPEPPDEPVDDELLEAIGDARCDDPAHRTPTTLTRLLEHAGLMNERSWFGLLTSMQEGQNLIHIHAVKIQAATLSYAGRTVSFLRLYYICLLTVYLVWFITINVYHCYVSLCIALLKFVLLRRKVC